MNASELLSSMLSFFATPTNWCSGACARDENGMPVGPLSPNAVSWDIYGYLAKKNFEENPGNFEQLHLACDLVKGKITEGTSRDIEAWNDRFESVSDIIAILSE